MAEYKTSLYSRRNFLKVAGAAAGTGMLPGWARGTTSSIWTRQEVSTLSSTSPTIQTLKTAIGYFKSLAAAGTASMYNWQSLATIHYNSCAHGNWYFLPWHRPFVGYVEWLIQQYTNTPTFAMPYWNWTAHPQIPAVFSDTSSPLYDSTRQVSPTAQASSSFVGPSVMTNVMNTSDFQSFASKQATTQSSNVGYGAVEGTPHNYIHNWIDGDMGTYDSPLDPLFFMHHGNIDRLWVVWNNTHANTTTSSWLNYTLTYNGPNSEVGNWKVNQTLSTTAMGYTYDNTTSVT